MLDIGKYSITVSPYHLYRRATLRRLLIMFKDKGDIKTIKEINAITLDRVNSMINRIFDKNNKNCVIIYN